MKPSEVQTGGRYVVGAIHRATGETTLGGYAYVIDGDTPYLSWPGVLRGREYQADPHGTGFGVKRRERGQTARKRGFLAWRARPDLGLHFPVTELMEDPTPRGKRFSMATPTPADAVYMDVVRPSELHEPTEWHAAVERWSNRVIERDARLAADREKGDNDREALEQILGGHRGPENRHDVWSCSASWLLGRLDELIGTDLA